MKSNNRNTLKHGPSIFVIAPGMPFLKQDLVQTKKLVESWGCSVTLPQDLLGKDTLCSQSRKVRWQHLKQALQSSCDVIWAARGGYGSLHLLPELEKIKKPKKQKLLIGFSDITVLHQYFNQKWGWVTLHGPHFDRLHQLKTPQKKEMQKLLLNETSSLKFASLKPLNSAARALRSISAPVVGGNLITLQSLIGTPSEFIGSGKIVFLEDIGERGYRVDRVLEQMLQIQTFKNCKAILFGTFTGGGEPDGTSKVPAVLRDFAERTKIPVYSGLPCGHGGDSKPILLNHKSVLQKRKSRFELEIPCKGVL